MSEVRLDFTFKSTLNEVLFNTTVGATGLTITNPVLLIELYDHPVEFINQMKPMTHYLPLQTYQIIQKDATGQSLIYDNITSNTSGIKSVWTFFTDKNPTLNNSKSFRTFDLKDYQYSLNSVDYRKVISNDASYREFYVMLMRSFNRFKGVVGSNLPLEVYNNTHFGSYTITSTTHASANVLEITLTANQVSEFSNGQLVYLNDFTGTDSGKVNNLVFKVSAIASPVISVAVPGLAIADVINGAGATIVSYSDKLGHVNNGMFMVGQSLENELVLHKNADSALLNMKQQGTLVFRATINDANAPKFINHIMLFQRVIVFLPNGVVRLIS